MSKLQGEDTRATLLCFPGSIVNGRPYGGSEVIHQAGGQSQFSALERERPQIVNNFATSASPGYELASSSIG